MPLWNSTRLLSRLSISTAHNSLNRELMMGKRKPQGGRRKRLLRGKAQKWKKMHEKGGWKIWGRSKRSAKIQTLLGAVRLGAEAIQSVGAGEAKTLNWPTRSTFNSAIWPYKGVLSFWHSFSSGFLKKIRIFFLKICSRFNLYIWKDNTDFMTLRSTMAWKPYLIHPMR